MHNNTTVYMRRLIRKVKYWYHRYHIEYNPESEEMYESARTNLENFEHEYPSYIQYDSPSFVVGYGDTLTSKIHTLPMLSVAHSYDKLITIKKLKILLNHDSLVMEPKVDGVALSLYYEDGMLDCALLRGNGYKGEDIYALTHHISDIPQHLPYNITTIVRGELFLPKSTTDKHLRTQLAGLIRRNIVSNYGIKFIAYDIYDSNVTTRIMGNLVMIEYGFRVPKSSIITNISMIDLDSTTHEDLNYEVDGYVFKINSYSISESMGITSRYPKSVFAFKFVRSSVISTVIRIEWKMKKSGVIMPIIHIEPINMDNIVVSKVSGHNLNFIISRKLGIGAKVSISRVGNTAPQISNTVQGVDVIPLLLCPFCHIQIILDSINYICNNSTCYQKCYIEIQFFLKSLKINGLGTNMIKHLSNKYHDIDTIIKHLQSYDWIRNKSDEKVLQIIKSRHFSRKELWIAMGIPGISHAYINKLDFSVDISLVGDGIKDTIFLKYYNKYQIQIENWFQVLNNV